MGRASGWHDGDNDDEENADDDDGDGEDDAYDGRLWWLWDGMVVIVELMIRMERRRGMHGHF